MKLIRKVYIFVLKLIKFTFIELVNLGIFRYKILYKNICKSVYIQYNTFEEKQFFELTNQKIDLLAFYLPQFHPTPENDLWWGKNFTEWNNVVRAIPQYKDHYQPKLPYDVGFYNATDIETIKFQVEIAKAAGLQGFCYYYYWFNGKKLLYKPIQTFVNSGIKEFKYCFFYANDSWIRTWHGQGEFKKEEKEVLIQQSHSLEDDYYFIRELIHYFKDERYYKINNKPILIIYHTYLYPDIKLTSKLFRDEVKKEGFDDIVLLNVLMPDQINVDPINLGMDASLQFSPIGVKSRKLIKIPYNSKFKGNIYSYDEVVESELKRTFKYDVIRGCFPSWDNEARKPFKGTNYFGSTPDKFEKYLQGMIEYAIQNPIMGKSMVFINAWNEWAEGAYLEPDRKFGYAYLNRINRVLRKIN